jgi:ribosomal protein S27AE
MANVTDLCPQCGVSLANHVCPQRVGTVPGVVTTYSHNGATVTKVVRAVSKNNACIRCGLVHHNERGTKIVCTATAASNYFSVKVAPDSADFYRKVAEFLDYEAGNITAPTKAAPVAATLAPAKAATPAPVAAPKAEAPKAEAPKAEAPEAEAASDRKKRVKAELAKAR